MSLRDVRPRMSLTHRLLALTLAASLPGLAALAYTVFDLRNMRRDEIRAEAERNARLVVSEIDQIFVGLEATLHAAAQAAEVRKGDREACSDYLARTRAQLGALSSILVVEPDGTVRCVSEAGALPANVADRDYVRDALSTRRFAVGTYTQSLITNRGIVPMALPVSNDGEVAFLIAAGLSVEWLGQQLSERDLAHGAAITIADRNGVIVSHEPSPERFVGTKLPAALTTRFSDSAGTFEARGLDGVDRIIGFVPAALTPFGLSVSSSIAHSEAFGAIDRAVRNSLALLVLGSGVALVLAWLIGEVFIRRPLMRMVATAEAWRRGEHKVRTGMIDHGDEVSLLGQTFDRLMDENAQRDEQRAAAEQLRETLVHELAHRVKNTLATVNSIAALSFRHDHGPDALPRFQDRLQALTRSHDLLTRQNWHHAGLAEIAAAAMGPLKEERGDRFSISGLPVDLPPTTAVSVAMILHELCTNALKYGALSGADGKVTIRWDTEPDQRGTVVELTWAEQDGPPVAPPEHEGFGTRLISSLSAQLHGSYELHYRPSGLVCHLRFLSPASELRT